MTEINALKIFLLLQITAQKDRPHRHLIPEYLSRSCTSLQTSNSKTEFRYTALNLAERTRGGTARS